MSGSDSNVEVRVTATIAELKSQLNAAQAEVKAFAGSVDQINAMIAKSGPIVQASLTAPLATATAGADQARQKVADITAQIDAAGTASQRTWPAATGLMNQMRAAAQGAADEVERIGTASQRASVPAVGLMQQMRAEAQRAADAARDAAAAVDEIEPAAGRAHGGTSAVTREFIVIGHEAMQGRFSRIPGSLMVMAEYSGALTTMISALTIEVIAAGAAVAAVAAGFALWAYHAYEAETATKAATLAAMLGGRTGTRQEIEAGTKTAMEIDPGGAGYYETTRLVAKLNEFGELTDQDRKKIYGLLGAILEMNGGSVTAAEKWLEKNLQSSAAVEKLAKEYNLLSPAGVQAFDSTTSATEKTTMAIDALNARLAPAYEAFRKLNDEATIARANAALTGSAEGGMPIVAPSQQPSTTMRGDIPETSAALIDNTAASLGLGRDIANFATRLAQIESGGKQTGGAGSIAGPNEPTTSSTRALGMMQVEPDDRARGTTKTIGGQSYDLTDATQNVKASLLMIAESYRKHNGDLKEVAADYVGRGTSDAAVKERTGYLDKLGLSGGGGQTAFRPNLGEMPPGTTGSMTDTRDQETTDKYDAYAIKYAQLTGTIANQQEYLKRSQATLTAATQAAAGDQENAAVKAANGVVESVRRSIVALTDERAELRNVPVDTAATKRAQEQVAAAKLVSARTTTDPKEAALENAQAEVNAYQLAQQAAGISEAKKEEFHRQELTSLTALETAKKGAEGTWMAQQVATLDVIKDKAAEAGGDRQQIEQRVTEATKQYWQGVLQNDNLTANQRLQVQHQLSQATVRLAEETAAAAKKAQQDGLRATEARLSAEIAAARGNVAAITAAEAEKVAAVKAVHGAESAEYFAALAQQTNVVRTAVNEQNRVTIAGYGAQLAAAHGNLGQIIEIENQKLAFIRQAHGEESAEYQTALAQQSNALRTAVAEEIRVIEQTGKQRIASEAATLKAQAALGQISKLEELRQLEAFVANEARLENQAITRQMATLDQGSAAYKAALDARTKLAEQFKVGIEALHAQEAQSAQQSADREVAIYVQAFHGITSAGESSVVGLIKGQDTWLQAAQNVNSALLTGFVHILGEMLGKWVVYELAKQTSDATTQAAIAVRQAAGDSGIGILLARWLGLEAAKTTASTTGAATRTAATTAEGATENAGFLVRAARWIASELGMTAATSTGAATRTGVDTAGAVAAQAAQGLAARLQIAMAAADAAAWAFADSASLGPAGLAAAPGVAAAAYATVMATQVLVPLAVGAWDVSAGAYQLHDQEMVVPASFASGIRAALGGGATTNNTSNSGGSNDTHLHYNPTVAAGSGADVRQQLAAHAAELKSWVGNITRNGNLTPPRYS